MKPTLVAHFTADVSQHYQPTPIAVSVRRLQDTNRSGWWCWIVLIPCGIGGSWYLILMLLPSSEGQNQYG
ncbi:MAG: DUF805 domain-containing protein [Actinomycetia bacterium]|nr:DUF805 domain-containing protein [Actinomycetes bacterium]